MALALIVVGPDKLPGLAKTVAKQILELKKAANSLKDSLQDELAEERESLKELTSGLEDVDGTLANLDSAKRENEPEISQPATDEEADSHGGAEDNADSGATGQPASAPSETKETSPPA